MTVRITERRVYRVEASDAEAAAIKIEKSPVAELQAVRSMVTSAVIHGVLPVHDDGAPRIAIRRNPRIKVGAADGI